MNQESLDFLHEQHAKYFSHGQFESHDAAAMVELNHPNSTEYLTLQSDFNKLSVASGPASRFMTFIDMENHSQLLAPRLRVKVTTELSLDDAPSPYVYPYSIESWHAFLRHSASKNWNGSTPSLLFSGIRISTSSVETAKAVSDFIAECDMVGHRDRIKRGPTRFHIQPRNMDQYHLAKNFITTLHVDNILHKVDIREFNTPRVLPMNEKSISHHGQPLVWVTDKEVLLPLIPACTKAAIPIKAEITTALLQCLEQGMDWHTVERALRRILPKAEFATIKAAQLQKPCK